MNGLITEGIPLGIDVQILTGGLSFEPPPPPTPGAASVGGLLNVGVKQQLTPNISYAIPSSCTSISLQTVGAGVVDVYGSFDNIHWSVIASFTFGDLITIQTGIVFIQAVTESLADIYVIPRREKL